MNTDTNNAKPLLLLQQAFDALNEADAEVMKLRQIEEAAELACGLLWMVEERSEKVRTAFHALRDALGGSGSKGLGKAIKRAIDAGHEADHPPGADWWAGKKETPNKLGEGPGAASCARSLSTDGLYGLDNGAK
jgi:hypothetical protein